jgi:subtilisin family serine protease
MEEESMPSRSAGPGDASWRIRRRTLLTAAAAGAIGAVVGPGRAQASPSWYPQAFAAMVAADPDIRAYLTPGQEFWCRPRQLLVAPADLSRVMARLLALGYAVTSGAPFAGVERVLFAADVNIKAIVEDLRDPANWAPAPPPAVQPHHVVFGYPNVMGSPGGAPAVAASQRPSASGNAGTNQLVGICDTGIWAAAQAAHPDWFGDSYNASPADFDPLYSGGTTLALQGGHGTFVAGVLRGTAPAVQFDPKVALSADGVGDEESVCAALHALDPAVSFTNLSLGCHTQGDLPPMPMTNALAARPAVVVAAAGNASTTRPTWPAALPAVVAVAGLQSSRSGLVPADYSNHGPWVDLCARGDWTGPYVSGVLDPPEGPALSFVGWARWQGTSFAVPYAIGRMAELVTTTGVDPATAATLLKSGPPMFPGFGALVP